MPDSDVAPGFASLRRTLVKGWKDVDVLTRK
jgi:putative membrane protein